MTLRNSFFIFPICVFAVFVIGSPASAQPNSYIQALRPLSANEGEPLVVSAALNNASSITTVLLYYRQLGVSEFRTAEMQVMGDSAAVTIASTEIAPPFLELYVAVETRSGLHETYPAANPAAAPSRITITPRPDTETGVLILSPEQHETMLPEDLYVTVSYVYAGDAIDKRKTRLVLNGTDITARAMTMGDLLIITSPMIPETLKRPGMTLAVHVFDTTGAPCATLRRSFSLSRTTGAGSDAVVFSANGSAQAESRSETVRGASRVYNRLDVRGNSTYGILHTTANLQLTSEERPGNQPQNRYFLGFDARYAKLGLGDTYPQFPSTMMDGRRVRGASLEAGYGAVHLNASTGEIARGVERDGSTQTHRRTLTAVRPSFGTGEHFRWGFTYLHSKDHWSAGTSLKPRENVAAGTDIYASVDNKRIEWTAQASISISNLDISSAEFTADSIDAAVARGSIDASDGDNLKRLLPIASKLITFNENISPLNPSGLSSLACETSLSFNYFNNFIKGTYTFHGNEYTSFGTSSFRNDIQGYNITDRLRLLGNALFVTASIERLSNNVSKYDPVTTDWTNGTASVSYFGAARVPDVTLGFSANTISNDAPQIDSVYGAYPAIDYATKRVFVQSSYGFSWIGRHSAMVSVDYSNADDRTSRDQDMTGFNGMLTMTSTHSSALESTLGFTASVTTLPVTYYTTEQSGGQGSMQSPSSMNYYTLTIGAGYRFFGERMKATASASPTFGDVERTQLEARLQFAVMPRHMLTAQYHYIVNSSLEPTVLMPHVNDSAFTIAYRMDL